MALRAKDFCNDIEDEYAFFNEICERVIKNPRFYLEHCDDRNPVLQTYYFSFIDYDYRKVKHKPKPL